MWSPRICLLYTSTVIAQDLAAARAAKITADQAVAELNATMSRARNTAGAQVAQAVAQAKADATAQAVALAATLDHKLAESEARITAARSAATVSYTHLALDSVGGCAKAAAMNEDDIRAVLAPFNLGKMLDGLHVGDGLVQVTLAIKREDAAALEPMRRDVEAAVAKLPGVKNASVVFTAHKAPPPPPPVSYTHLGPECRRPAGHGPGKSAGRGPGGYRRGRQL